ncbi:MAG: hypothetical protein CFE45_04620 [Burkholderiales bacterium PBB5]|nr:MAG: hypothetical protein CFE45_04620 [Burkholderiales bacterium PBB5]
MSLAGAFESRARLRPGLGCLTLPAEIADDATPLDAAQSVDGPDGLPLLRQPVPQPDALGEAPGEAVVAAADPQLQLALSRALVDVPGQPAHRTKAVVVMHRGRLIAERYAPGYGVHTPVLGFSATKSLSNALLGILVRQGRLALDQPVPLPEWQDPADPRHAITVAQLLRQTPGLDLPQDNSGFDSSAQIMYTVRDKAAAAAAAPLAVPPGSRWAYSDTNFVLLSRVMRDAAGGSTALLRLARDELFAPLGMRDVVIDVDSTGTPVGASHGLASARDWARFGQLYLDDGVKDGRRILPAGWVAMSATPTLATGYGAGFWTNRVPGNVPGWGVPWGLARAPADTFFARGFMGQFVVVVPSRQLVVVRLSVSSQRGDDIEATDQLVADILAALPPGP